MRNCFQNVFVVGLALLLVFHMIPGALPLANAATLDAEAPVITTQPQDQSVNEGGSVTLSVYATVSQGTLSYQWYRNTSPVYGGFAVNGATSATLTKTMAGVGDDYYYVVVTNTDSAATVNQISTVTSDLAKVTVNALTHAAAPTITTQPLDQSVNEGGSVTLSVYATVSQGTLSYQWYRNTSPVIGGFAVNGAT
ncbi:hypothetical protein PV433_06095, partial [Paenibacillus sp. GYB004]